MAADLDTQLEPAVVRVRRRRTPLAQQPHAEAAVRSGAELAELEEVAVGQALVEGEEARDARAARPLRRAEVRVVLDRVPVDVVLHDGAPDAPADLEPGAHDGATDLSADDAAANNTTTVAGTDHGYTDDRSTDDVEAEI